MLQPQDLESVRHYQALDLVIRWRDTLKALESLQGCYTSLGLVWYHSAQGSSFSDVVYSLVVSEGSCP